MRLKQNVSLFAIGFLLIFAVGCTTTTTGSQQTGSGAFLGGTKGLALEFLAGAPPEMVFDTNYPFSINVRVEDIGEWDVAKEDAQFKLTGINPNDFAITTTDLVKFLPEDLQGAQKDPNGNVITGTISNIEYPTLQYTSTVAGQVQFNVRVDACYGYGTRAQTQLCIVEDFLGRTGEEGVCEPSEAKVVENSGSPVHVTSFTESVVGTNKVSFIFKIKHVGAGNVYEPGTTCNADYQHKNKIKVKVINPNLGPLTCSGLDGGTLEGLVWLNSEDTSVRCTLTVDDASLGDYNKVLNMVLEYDYKDSVEAPLVVKQGS